MWGLVFSLGSHEWFNGGCGRSLSKVAGLLGVVQLNVFFDSRETENNDPGVCGLSQGMSRINTLMELSTRLPRCKPLAY